MTTKTILAACFLLAATAGCHKEHPYIKSNNVFELNDNAHDFEVSRSATAGHPVIIVNGVRKEYRELTTIEQDDIQIPEESDSCCYHAKSNSIIGGWFSIAHKDARTTRIRLVRHTGDKARTLILTTDRAGEGTNIYITQRRK